jgi:hypothetical protein
MAASTVSTKRGDRHKIRRRRCWACGRLMAIHSNGTVYGHYDNEGMTCRATFTKIGTKPA